MRILLVNDTSGQSNWGCRATSYQLKRLLTAAGGSVHSSVLVNELSQPVTPRWLPARLRWLAPDTIPARLADFDRFARRLLAGKVYLRGPARGPCDLKAALEQADLIYVNGEGSLHGDRRVARAIFFVAYVAKRYLNKPCVLMNHTADLAHTHLRQMAERVYPLLDDVAFREPVSAETCRHLTAHVKGDLVVPDAAFLWEPAPPEQLLPATRRPDYYSLWPDLAAGFDPLWPYVCVGASSIYYRVESSRYDPVPAFHRLCQALHATVAPVVLTAPCKNDERIFREVAHRLGLPLIGLHTPTQQAADILGNALLFISGRWHPSILAARGGTPVITLTANTFKLNALNRLLELDAPTFDALRLEEQLDDLIALARLYADRNDALRPAIRERARLLAERAPENARLVRRQAAKAAPDLRRSA